MSGLAPVGGNFGPGGFGGGGQPNGGAPGPLRFGAPVLGGAETGAQDDDAVYGGFSEPVSLTMRLYTF